MNKKLFAELLESMTQMNEIARGASPCESGRAGWVRFGHDGRERFQLAPGEGIRRAFRSAAIVRADIPSANFPKISSTMNASPRSILPSWYP